MARGRLLSKQISEDKDVARLDDGSALAFTWALAHLDRDGLITGEPILLWARIAPYRVHFRDHIGAWINQWVEMEFVIRYDTDNGPVLFFPNFAKHQQGMKYEREAMSSYPPPPGYVRTQSGLQLNSGGTPDKVRTNSGGTPEELPLNSKVEDQAENQTEGEDQEQQQQQARLSKLTEAARLAAAAGLLAEIGVISSVISDILKKRPNIEPETIAAWYVYTQTENEAKRRRKERELTMGFIVTQLRTGAIPPDWALEDYRTQRMIEDVMETVA